MITMDISLERLMFFYLLILVPLGFMYYLGAGLIRKLVLAVFRMTLQLFLVGLYLGHIFTYNSFWLNIGWIAVMLLVAAGHIIRSAGLSLRILVMPVLAALALAMVVVLTPLILYAVAPVSLYDARYLIPLGGMLLGNFLSMNIISLKYFTIELRSNRQYLQAAFCSGATVSEAVRPFYREAFVRALTPIITTTGTMGLISLPGMLTGQLLGGSLPTVAIKYQLIIILAIVVAGSISVFMTLRFILCRLFTAYGNLRADIFQK